MKLYLVILCICAIAISTSSAERQRRQRREQERDITPDEVLEIIDDETITPDDPDEIMR